MLLFVCPTELRLVHLYLAKISGFRMQQNTSCTTIYCLADSGFKLESCLWRIWNYWKKWMITQCHLAVLIVEMIMMTRKMDCQKSGLASVLWAKKFVIIPKRFTCIFICKRNGTLRGLYLVGWFDNRQKHVLSPIKILLHLIFLYYGISWSQNYPNIIAFTLERIWWLQSSQYLSHKIIWCPSHELIFYSLNALLPKLISEFPDRKNRQHQSQK